MASTIWICYDCHETTNGGDREQKCPNCHKQMKYAGWLETLDAMLNEIKEAIEEAERQN